MAFSVTGRHIDIGDALRGHVDATLESIFDKYFGGAIDADVIFAREGAFYHARINAHVGRGLQMVAESKADKPYAAFDGAAERLSKRLRRHKRRLRDHHAAQAVPLETLAGRQYVLSGDETAEDAEADAATPADGQAEGQADGQPAIIAEMSHEIPSLSVSEAVLRLDLGELPALLFRNAAHGGFNMIYRRPDGHIGWVDPEGTTAR